MGRDEESYREDLCSVKSDSDTIRAESPDSSRGDSNSEYTHIYVPMYTRSMHFAD
jgi:hypothetical protein